MRWLHFFLLLVVVSCATRFDPQKSYQLTLLHTNDHHGRFWSNRDGEWGLSARKTLIDQLRTEAKAKGEQVLLLDAGDVNTGVPQSDMLKAEPDFKGMARIGYDAMAVGNHEFDNDLATIRRQEDWAGFPFLSANIYRDGKRLFRPYVIRDLGGLKVAILGLTTKDTPLKSRMLGHTGVEFRDPIEEARGLVPELRRQAQVVIAVTHMGHYADEQHGADAPGDVTLARQVQGIDVIIGGHTQKPLFQADQQNGTYIVQAHEWGKYVGKVELTYAKGALSLKDYRLIPVNHLNDKVRIPEDEHLRAFLQPFKAQGDKTLLVKVGMSSVKLVGDRDQIRFKETNLGNLVTEAYRRKFKADVGISNSGGIRDSIPAGVVNYENVLSVLPFGNDIVTVSLTGKELKAYLAQILTEMLPGTGGFPQISGLELVFDAKTKTFRKLVVANKPLNDRQAYLVALPSFIAGGGDKWPNLSRFGIRSYGFSDADILREFFTELGEVQPLQFGPFGHVKVLRE